MRAFTSRPRLVAAPRRVPVCRAVNVGKAKKLSYEKIDLLVEALEQELLRIRMLQSNKQKFTPTDIPARKKEIARLMTARRQKEIDEGITRRQSRRNRVKKLVEEGMKL